MIRTAHAVAKASRFTTSVKATKGGSFTASAGGRTSKPDAIKVYVNQRRTETLYSIDADEWTASAAQTWTARVYV